MWAQFVGCLIKHHLPAHVVCDKHVVGRNCLMFSRGLKSLTENRRHVLHFNFSYSE